MTVPRKIRKLYNELFEIQRPVDIYTIVKNNEYSEGNKYTRKHPSLIKEYFENSRRMADFLKDKFEKLGFSVEIERVRDIGLDCRNVVARCGEGDEKIGLGFHHDINYLEGASDGKSQVITGLLGAEVLAKKKLESELLIIAFDAEEYSLSGSQKFAGENDLKFLLNVDNVSSGRDLAVVGKTMYAWYPERIIKFFENEGIKVETWESYSDSDSFVMHGIPSITLTCTHEHRIANTVEDCYYNINFNTLAKAVKKVPELIEKIDKKKRFQVDEAVAENARNIYKLVKSRIKSDWILGSRLLNHSNFTVEKTFERIEKMDRGELRELKKLLRDTGKENFLFRILPYVGGKPSNRVKRILGIHSKKITSKVKSLLEKEDFIKKENSTMERKRLKFKLDSFKSVL